MQTKQMTGWTIGAVLATLALLLAACGGSGDDKAGGAAKEKPHVLTLANPIDGGPPAQLSRWAGEVERLSDGSLAIEFKNGWRLGEPGYEAGTLKDVRAGKVDMAWVGARVFDTVGVTSFQALVSPLLVDSYELEAEVFEQGIPERMLEGVGELDLVGIGVLPGPMRKLLGVSKAFVRPGDFAGEVVGLQESAVADSTLRALGATPRPVASSAELDGLDAYEQQLSSIEGNGYDAQAKYVTANLNLWPRPLVIAMAKEAFDSLTSQQQSILRDAAEAAVPESLAASRAEDDEAAPVLCRRGMTFAVASPDDLADLRAALEPVYAELTSDPETKSHIDAIKSLKEEVAAPADASPCKTAEPASGKASSIPNGTYKTTVTLDDWVESGLPEEAADGGTGVFEMVFDDGDLTLFGPDGEIGFRARYTVFRDKIEARAYRLASGDTVNARWSFDGQALRFTDVQLCVESSCADEVTPYAVVWGSHPWARAAAEPAAIDGVYRTAVTLAALKRSPLKYDEGEVNNENWGDLKLTLDQGRVKYEQKNNVASSSASGTYTIDGDAIVLEFTEGVTAGENFAFRWSLYQDTLTFTRDEELGVAPTPYVIKPWRRVK